MSTVEILLQPNDIKAAFWSAMNQGCHSRKSQYHTLYFSYLREDKTDHTIVPHTATVVLRHFNINEKLIAFHSDIRHIKMDHLQKNNRVHCLFYSSTDKTQWRMSGRCRIEHQSEFTKRTWSRMPELSKFCYVSDYAPGLHMTERSSGFSTESWENKRDLINHEDSDKNFAIVVVDILSVEWLYLSSLGHQRGLWTVSDDQWQWLAP